MTASIPSVYAHSVNGQPDPHWQTIADHASQVAALTRTRADKFGAGALGEVAGLLHNLGKYSDDFQRKLRGAEIRVDNSTAGARLAVETFGRTRPLGHLLAYAIAGHHTGLAKHRAGKRGGRYPIIAGSTRPLEIPYFCGRTVETGD